MPIIRCQVVATESGARYFIPFALEDGVKAILIDSDKPIFNVLSNGNKIDLRTKPPFHSIIPCPWCNTDNDRKHDVSKHTSSKCNTYEAEVIALAKDIAFQFEIENRWGDLTVLAATELLAARVGNIGAKTRAERVREVLARRQVGTYLADPMISASFL